MTRVLKFNKHKMKIDYILCFICAVEEYDLNLKDNQSPITWNEKKNASANQSYNVEFGSF